EQVRANPADEQVRMFLFQLFALLGDWNRAKAQLETLAKLSPEMRMLSVAYGQCLDAEAERAAVMAGAQPASFYQDYDWTPALAEAIRLGGLGEAGAEARRDAAFDAAPATPGTADGAAFDWIADADMRFGPTIEAIIGGRYALMPFAALESIEISPAQDLRDTIWAQAQFALREGPQLAGFIPVRYPGSEAADEAELVRGLTTDWRAGPAGETGLGHRILTTSEGADLPLLSVRSLSFG
ncbi:MAG TPA: type VI secretion system accessory protein TagJ, partial [Sphingopyxis sp.]|nr:type VI secretion system accessory protein TagJ [Sphingopyxis sp.]